MLVPREKDTDWEIGHSGVIQVLERCVHLACNIFNFTGGGEARILSMLALVRSHLVGSMGGGLETMYEYNKRKREEVKMVKSKDKGKKEKKKGKKK